ncbi:helix loop helix DNA-binding domain protein [Ceratobasidium sp. AG-Ba]|nr:helix loop helix DNA-binding domain protein [Ceratobasidium sp. AG-Ba]QRW10873.1 helix loop helix DNA-binding domain protein [Ceratobasidium sp. AG-Ba]
MHCAWTALCGERTPDSSGGLNRGVGDPWGGYFPAEVLDWASAGNGAEWDGKCRGAWGAPAGSVLCARVWGRAEVRLLSTTMAFYISQPKVRQAGFELPAKDEERQPSPAPAYDPSMYFAHNNFGSPFDAFSNARLKYANGDHSSVDFVDTLSSLISESDARNAANGTPTNGHHFHPQPQPNPFDPHQFPHAASNHPILSPTGSAFSPGTHLHHAHHLPASAPATSHPSFFDSAAHDYAFLRGPPTDRADTPSLASPTTADSPFSQTAPQSSIAPSKRGSGSAASRSRSRGPAAASTSRSRARKRLSVSSPSPPPSASSAVLIPSQNAWYIPAHGSQVENGSFGFTLGSHGTPSSLTMPMAGQSPKSMGAKVSMAEDIAQKQAQLLSEKRRRRRESHNAVERRRRDNINEKISELSTLIPECLLSENPAPTKDDVLGAVDEEGTKEGPKANKGMILRKSVDYIKYLQQLVRAQASRNRELESQLSQIRGSDAAPSDPSASLLSGAGSMGGATSHLDFDGLLTIPTEDGEDAIMTSDMTSQIIATLEANQDQAPTASTGQSPSVDGMEDDEEDTGDETERGRQHSRRGRFGYPSLSVGKSAKVEEVDESALSVASEKMED